MFLREMVHMAIDGMWQIFKLQRSTPRNDFCRIAAKNGILLRLINTLYSLNEATRLASSVGSGQNELLLSSVDEQDIPKVRHGVTDHQMEPLNASTSHPQKSDVSYPVDIDMNQFINSPAEFTSLEKGHNLVSRDSTVSTVKDREMDRRKTDPSRADAEPRQQRLSISANRTSTDRLPKLTEPALNGLTITGTTQQEQVRPLLSLLEKEPPRHFSGQLELVRQLSSLEKHESALPLLHASDKKTNGELDFLMAEFEGNAYLLCIICLAICYDKENFRQEDA